MAVLDCTGALDLFALGAAGSAKVEEVSSGALSLYLLSMAGTSVVSEVSSGALDLQRLTASGSAKVQEISSGAMNLKKLTAVGQIYHDAQSFGPGEPELAPGINNQVLTTYTYLHSDRERLVLRSNSAPMSDTLPTATGAFGSGFRFQVENLGSGTCTITPTSGTINGGGTLVLIAGQGAILESDGHNWVAVQAAAGVQGIQGVKGDTGLTGPAGANGNTILYGTAAPTTEGSNGDFYIRTTTNFIYGPKAGGAWPAGTSLIGPAGADGTTSVQKRTIDLSAADILALHTTPKELIPAPAGSEMIHVIRWFAYLKFVTTPYTVVVSGNPCIDYLNHAGRGQLGILGLATDMDKSWDCMVGNAPAIHMNEENLVADGIGQSVILQLLSGGQLTTGDGTMRIVIYYDIVTPK